MTDPWKQIARKFNIYSVLPGHSLFPCDCDFRHIEKFLSGKEVYSFNHYATVIGNVQNKNSFAVVNMKRSMFRDIGILSKMIIKRKIECINYKMAKVFIVDDSHKDNFT